MAFFVPDHLITYLALYLAYWRAKALLAVYRIMLVGCHKAKCRYDLGSHVRATLHLNKATRNSEQESKGNE